MAIWREVTFSVRPTEVMLLLHRFCFPPTLNCQTLVKATVNILGFLDTWLEILTVRYEVEKRKENRNTLPL